MADVRIKLNAAGIRELCLSDEMERALKGQAAKLATKANADAYTNVAHLHLKAGRFLKVPYSVNSRKGRGTAVAFANTATTAAAYNEARNKSLMKQLHG